VIASRYMYRAIDKHGTPVDFLLTAKRDLEAAKRFFRKMLRDEPLLAPDRIGTDGALPIRRPLQPPEKTISCRTGCCRSASDFRRPTKRKTGVGEAYCAAYARVC